MTSQGKDCIILLDKLYMDHLTECQMMSNPKEKENVIPSTSPDEEKKQSLRRGRRARKSGLLAELQKLQISGFESQLTISSSLGQAVIGGTPRRFSMRIRERSVSRCRNVTGKSSSPVSRSVTPLKRKPPQRNSSARSETSKKEQTRKRSTSRSEKSSRSRGMKRSDVTDQPGYSALSDEEQEVITKIRRKRSLSVKSCPGGLPSKASLGFPERVSLDRKCKSKEKMIEPSSSEEDDSLILSLWNELSSKKKPRKRSRSVISCSGLSSTPYRSSTPRSCKSLILYGEDSDFDDDVSVFETPEIRRSPSVEPRQSLEHRQRSPKPRQRSPKPRQCKSRIAYQPDAPPKRGRSRKSLFEEREAAKRSGKRLYRVKSCPDLSAKTIFLHRHEEHTSGDPYDYILEPNEDIPAYCHRTRSKSIISASRDPQIEASKIAKRRNTNQKKFKPSRKKQKCSEDDTSNKENENTTVQEKWNEFVSSFHSTSGSGADAFKQFEKVFAETLKHLSEISAGEKDSPFKSAAVHSRKDSTSPRHEPSTTSNGVNEREGQSAAERHNEVSSQFNRKDSSPPPHEPSTTSNDANVRGQIAAKRNNEVSSQFKHKKLKKVWEAKVKEVEQVIPFRADNVDLEENIILNSDESTTSTVLFPSDADFLAGKTSPSRLLKSQVFQPTSRVNKKPKSLRKKSQFKRKLLSSDNLNRNQQKRSKKASTPAQKNNNETAELHAPKARNSEEFTSIVEEVSTCIRQLHDDHRIIAELQAEATNRPSLAHSLKTVITSRYLRFQQKLKTFRSVIMKGYDRLVKMCEEAKDVSVEISEVTRLSIDEVNKVISRCNHIEDISSEFVDGITGSSPQVTAQDVNCEQVSGQYVRPDDTNSNQNQSTADSQYVQYIYNTNIYSGCGTQPPTDIPEVSRPEASETTAPSQPTQNFAPNVYVYPSSCKPKQTVTQNSSPMMPPPSYQDCTRTRVSPMKSGFIIPEARFAPPIPTEVLMRKPVGGLLAMHQEQVMYLNRIINQDHGYTFGSQKSTGKTGNLPSAVSLEEERRRSVRLQSDLRQCDAPVGAKGGWKTAPVVSRGKRPPEARVPPTTRQPQQMQLVLPLPNQSLRPPPPRKPGPWPVQSFQPQLWRMPRQPSFQPTVRPPLPRQAINRPLWQPPQFQPPPPRLIQAIDRKVQGKKTQETGGKSTGPNILINYVPSAVAISQPSTTARAQQPQPQPQAQAQAQAQAQSSTFTAATSAPMLQIVASNLLRNTYPCAPMETQFQSDSSHLSRNSAFLSRNSTIAGTSAIDNASPSSVPACDAFSTSRTSPAIDPTTPHRLTMKDNRLQSGGALASSPHTVEQDSSCKVEPVDEVISEASSDEGENVPGTAVKSESGERLCAVRFCRNPGRLMCTACKCFIYCSKICQETHWNVHKKACQSLRRLPDRRHTSTSSS